MRPQMSLARWSLVLAAAVAAAACSGGGSTPGGDLTLSTYALSFSAVQGDPVPPPQVIQATISAPDAAIIAAGFAAEAPPPTWATVSLAGSGTVWNVTVSITQTSLAPGTYAATARVGIGRSDGSVIKVRDVQLTYVVSASLTVSPATLDFTHVLGGVTGTQPVAVGGTAGVGWTAAASQAWVTLGASSGTTPSTVAVGVDPTGLVVGTYTATVTFTGAGLTRPVAVTLQVRQPALAVSATALPFGGVNGAPFSTQALAVSMDNGAAVTWTATPGAGWMVLDRSTGTTPDTVAVGVDPSIGPLAAGFYTAPLTVSASYGGSTLTATVDVSLTLTRATLSLPASLLLGGADGRDLSSKQVQVSLDTGANAYAWSAVASDTWMTLPAASGTASATPVAVSVVPDRTGLVGGTRTGTIAFTATVNGDTVTASVPVTFNLESHRLLASQQGVALASTPGPSRLTRTLAIKDNLGLGAPWTAASNQAWLAVTPSGTADGPLTLTADPTGLAADALHMALVTVGSTDPTVENSETVRVGLWVGSAAPAASTAVAGLFREIVADPVRPYAYVNANGSDVSIYHAYTGAKVGTIASVGGSLAGMAVSGDGSRLYAIDKAASTIVPVDLDTATVGGPWGLTSTGNTYPRLSWTRTGGQPVLVVTDGTLRDANGGVLAMWPASTLAGPPLVATSLDGSAFCAPGCRSLSYTALGGGTLSSGTRAGALGNRDGALSPDGSVVYQASGAPYEWDGYSTTNGVLVIRLGSLLAYPGNAAVGWDGRIYGGRYGVALASDHDVYVFDPAGTLLSSFRVSTGLNNLRDDEMVPSGDALRLLAVTWDYGMGGELRFVTIP